MGYCKKCERDRHIVNKHFGLCQECNNERLHGSKYGKQYKFIPKKIDFSKTPLRKVSSFNKKKKEKPKKSLFAKEQIERPSTADKIKQDEVFYLKCFKLSNHRCEECNTELPDVFRDDEGKIVARWRYSHIIPKSIASHLRHRVKNINHLCLLCHTKWEGDGKVEMKIYEENCKKFPNYF